MEKDQLSFHQSELTSFFLTALDFRAEHCQVCFPPKLNPAAIQILNSFHRGRCWGNIYKYSKVYRLSSSGWSGEDVGGGGLCDRLSDHHGDEAVRGHVQTALLQGDDTSFSPSSISIWSFVLVLLTFLFLFVLQLFDWSKSGSKDRLLTFYRLCDCIAERLKGLFVLFAGNLVKPFSDLLRQTNSSKTGEMLTPDILFTQFHLMGFWVLFHLIKVYFHMLLVYLNLKIFYLNVFSTLMLL